MGIMEKKMETTIGSSAYIGIMEKWKLLWGQRGEVGVRVEGLELRVLGFGPRRV